MSETPEDHAAELAAWRKEAAGAFADLAAEFGIGAKTNLSVDQISAALRKRLEHARLPMHDRLGMIVEALGLIAGDTKWGHLGWDDVVAGVKALKGRVERAEAGLERFREVVEAKLPEYAPKADAPPDEVADERQRCAEPLDLATLRVPTSETDGTVVLIAEDGRLVITDDVGNNVGVAQLPPTSARLLARMLMQSADAEEAKGASPQAYEPDSEDGS